MKAAALLLLCLLSTAALALESGERLAPWTLLDQHDVPSTLVYPESFGLFHIGFSISVCYKRIKIVNMIVFWTRVFTALETIFNTAMFHTAPCDFTRLISFTATAARTVFIQKHGAKPAIQPT